MIGGVYALYNTSPELTLAVGIVLPTIIIIGTYLGSILRKLSRQAQDQVLKKMHSYYYLVINFYMYFITYNFRVLKPQ